MLSLAIIITTTTSPTARTAPRGDVSANKILYHLCAQVPNATA
jgi:hypothetical protein